MTDAHAKLHRRMICIRQGLQILGKMLVEEEGQIKNQSIYTHIMACIALAEALDAPENAARLAAMGPEMRESVKLISEYFSPFIETGDLESLATNPHN